MTRDVSEINETAVSKEEARRPTARRPHKPDDEGNKGPINFEHISITENTQFKYPSEVLATRIEDEIVLLHLETEIYFSLNETGARIWELLPNSNFKTLIENLQIEYNDPDINELKSHLRELYKNHLLELL